jgi:hypothetical protein
MMCGIITGIFRRDKMTNSIRKIMTGWAAAVMLASAGSLVAHHSLAQFDTDKAVTVKGTVVLFERVNPHSILFLDEKRKNGQTLRWAVEGPGTNLLTRRGIEKDFLKAGTVIEVCGYATKEGVPSQRTVNTEPISLSLKDKMPKSVSGQVLTGELLTLPDGTTQILSDYGHHKCLGANYQDIHTR